ncbi:redoxin domain-containing protein [Haematospirillum sp. 15-248]|uniref:thioredoxin-like domain-containing protein n=1 Tax=Haematospirillum sp. 15-248 TaxID=2723107 RepID=UPI0014392112|nr:thioredoxin-like domain-containing protein [Haematospirillum sp. 15-248]NKD86837.1 redoxin domain-containing protein [Haematospirillum sp. 15-248]
MYGPVHAPELKGKDLVWINTPSPLLLSDLKGRLVILDFWTFCCINCIQVMPTLKQIENAFPDDVVVIGVHSPKFMAEENANAVRSAVQRYDLTHPVLHDPHHILWNQYAVRAWPTLIFIGPDGKIIGRLEGEPDPERLESAIRDIVAEIHQQGHKGTEAKRHLSTPLEHSGNLRFPGKIKPIPNSTRAVGTPAWAVADSGHHRISVLDDSGTLLFQVGNGKPGYRDGDREECRFNSPQGLVCTKTDIFVADTGNHSVRRINLKSGHASTLGGNGQRGTPIFGTHEAPHTALASPWDLEIHKQTLWIANAGTHQILALDLDRMMIRQMAGSGGEDLLDGAARHALLAQPSGLHWREEEQALYFADSETSSIRRLSVTRNTVETLAGHGLFDFGLQDGPGKQALLQHPLGLCGHGKSMYVADSYNNCIRMIDTTNLVVTTFEHGKLECRDMLCQPLEEPAGIWCDGESRLLVSDTNNHRILEIHRHNNTMISWYS